MSAFRGSFPFLDYLQGNDSAGVNGGALYEEEEITNKIGLATHPWLCLTFNTWLPETHQTELKRTAWTPSFMGLPLTQPQSHGESLIAIFGSKVLMIVPHHNDGFPL